MTALRDRYLKEIGIPVWRVRTAPTVSAPVSVPKEVALETARPAPLEGAAQGVDAWSELQAKVRACTLCGLHRGRTQTVFGVGRRDARLFVIGEAPGADEDRQGEPFVGRAGQLLNAMLRSIGLPRAEVYIANILKCRPPNNRDPQPDEVESCEPFLFQQIAAIRPKVIVALGSFAAKTLLRSDESISRLRGRIYDFHGAQLIPTFHPSFLLRSPDRKRDAWEDLKKARALLTAAVTPRE